MKSKSLLLSACALLLAAFATNLAKAAEGEHPLPSSALSIKEAVKQSSLIVEANLIDLGPAITEGYDAAAYRKATFNIYGYLKGRSESPIVVTLTVMSGEFTPKKERHYLLFVTHQGKQSATSSTNNPIVLKILDATPQQISQVNHAVAALSQ
ncbi:hypothetical protein BH09VER1_BH09VER1_54330 [soil metagenome]